MWQLLLLHHTNLVCKLTVTYTKRPLLEGDFMCMQELKMVPNNTPVGAGKQTGQRLCGYLQWHARAVLTHCPCEQRSKWVTDTFDRHLGPASKLLLHCKHSTILFCAANCT